MALTVSHLSTLLREIMATSCHLQHREWGDASLQGDCELSSDRRMGNLYIFCDGNKRKEKESI
jgi:hypothetical protein